MKRSQQSSQHGFTLIEIILVVVLVGLMMAGMTRLYVANVGSSHEPLIRQKSLAVANALMDEIIHKAWDDNSPIGGGCVNTGSGYCPGGPMAAGSGNEETSRAHFDDIDDYNQIRNQSPPQDAEGQDMAEYAGFSVSIFIDQNNAWNGIPAADVKHIQLQLLTPLQETISLSAYRVNN